MAQIVKLITKNSVSQAMQVALLLQKRWESNSDAPDLELVLREPKRSSKQNSLIHGLFEQCAKVTGKKDADWWKDELKSKIGLKSVHFDMFEQPTVLIKGTGEYSKPEMTLFVEALQAHMSAFHKVEIDIKQAMEELGADNKVT